MWWDAATRAAAVRTVSVLLGLLVSGLIVACESTNPVGHSTDIELEEPGVVVAPAGSATTTVNVLDRRQAGTDIVLATELLPTGISVAFDPNEFDGATSVATVTADEDAAEGEFEIVIEASEPESEEHGANVDHVTLLVTVVEDPDAVPATEFRLSVRGVDPREIDRPGTDTFGVVVAPLQRFTGWVRFSVTGLTNDFHIRQFDDIRFDGGRPVTSYLSLVFEPVGEVPETLRMTITATGPATSHSVSRRLVVTYTASPTQPGTGPTAPGS